MLSVVVVATFMQLTNNFSKIKKRNNKSVNLIQLPGMTTTKKNETKFQPTNSTHKKKSK